MTQSEGQSGQRLATARWNGQGKEARGPLSSGKTRLEDLIPQRCDHRGLGPAFTCPCVNEGEKALEPPPWIHYRGCRVRAVASDAGSVIARVGPVGINQTAK